MGNEFIEKLKKMRKSLHPKCLENGGCEKIEKMIWGVTNSEVTVCSAYVNPSALWNRGDCPMATNIVKEDEKKKKFINPIKRSKRGRR